MRYFIDTEFIDDGKTIDLISIGIVCEDGREYYAQSVEFDVKKANMWVEAHVYPHMQGCPAIITDVLGCLIQKRIHQEFHLWHTSEMHCPWRTRTEIAVNIKYFMDPDRYGTPEFYGWCAGYDFVALCQLFGTMMDLPQGYPHYIRDLQYLLDEHGIADADLPPQEQGIHNALDNARHLAHLWKWVQEQENNEKANALLNRPLNHRLAIERGK